MKSTLLALVLAGASVGCDTTLSHTTSYHGGPQEEAVTYENGQVVHHDGNSVGVTQTWRPR